MILRKSQISFHSPLSKEASFTIFAKIHIYISENPIVSIDGLNVYSRNKHRQFRSAMPFPALPIDIILGVAFFNFSQLIIWRVFKSEDKWDA